MKEIEFIKNPKYDQNDIGTSNLFMDMFEDDLLFCPDAGWYIWNGKYWERDDKDGGKVNELVKQMALYCLRKIISNPELSADDISRLTKYYSKILSKKYRDTIIADAKSIRPVKMEKFDKHKLLFNCQNGTYDFSRNMFRDFSRSDYLTDISNVTFDPDAKCPRFQKYLNEVMEDDQTKIDYLLKIAAYCLTGDTTQECFFILYGDKTRNGKSTFVNTLSYLMGSYTKSVSPSSISKKTMNTGGSNANPDIAKLKNTRLATVSEIEDGMMLDVALIKQLTGGNTLTARFLYKEQFDFIPQFKILIDTNFLPRMSDDSVFKSDRIHLICFDRHFEKDERDLELKEKLKYETSGIFNLIVPYYNKLCKEGFILPESTQKTMEEYQYNSNNVLLFVKEQLYEDKSAWETMTDIYKSYQNWCDENGLNVMAKKTFKDRLVRCGARATNELARHTNSRYESIVARDWVRGYSLNKPASKFTEIKTDELPF